MTMTQHPLSAAFPSMPEQDFILLKDDIDINGQRDPIVVFDGQVLDGWHRYRACMDLGIKVLQVEFKGDDPIEFVLSRNLHRRHLTGSQRAAAVVACNAWAPVGVNQHKSRVDTWCPPSVSEPQKAATPSPVFSTTDAMARAANVSASTIKDAKAAHKAGLGDAVKEGALTAKEAANIAKGKTSKKPATSKNPPPPESVTQGTSEPEEDLVAEAMGSLDPLVEWERAMAENRRLEEQIKALQADDTAKELAKQIGIRQGIEGRLNMEMEKVNHLQRELDAYGKWYAELRKLTGKERRGEITSLLKKLLAKEVA